MWKSPPETSFAADGLRIRGRSLKTTTLMLIWRLISGRLLRCCCFSFRTGLHSTGPSSLSLSLSLSFSLSLVFPSLYFHISLSFCFSVSLYVFFSLFISLSLHAHTHTQDDEAPSPCPLPSMTASRHVARTYSGKPDVMIDHYNLAEHITPPSISPLRHFLSLSLSLFLIHTAIHTQHA